MNIIGNVYGRLTIIRELPSDKEKYGKYSGRRLLAKCSCGKIKNVNKRAVLRGRVKSCGCLQIEKASTHGLSNTKLYNKFRGMIQRCYDPDFWMYPWYGGRGIIVCDEWKNDIKKFYNWANRNGYKDGLQIDRIDNDGNYEPSNCRFVTLNENMNNTSKTIFLYFNDERISLQHASKKYNIDATVLYQRIKKLKWSTRKALITPVRFMKRRKESQ
jgi:hypothetical protein